MRGIQKKVFPILGRNECRSSSSAMYVAVSTYMFLLVFKFVNYDKHIVVCLNKFRFLFLVGAVLCRG